MLNHLFELLIGFFRAGNLSFGGGGSIIPLVKTETVNTYHWLTLSQFSDAVAVCTSLSGPIATNLASYIGFRAASWPGAVIAILAVIVPTIVVLVWAGKLLEKHAESKSLKAILKGVRPVIVGLMIYVAYDMALNQATGAFLLKAPADAATLAIAAVAALASFKYAVHPLFLVIGALAAGYVIW
ncbi:MAG: chromate transporter [Peptococcaceae bacterium]|jgi:chromate transporter|nr:chromate transporter [Peptococcaceae bacterium]